MKRIFLLLALVVFVQCTKDEDPTVPTVPPTTTLPPPSITPPVINPPTTNEPTPYTSGDITISSKADLDAYNWQQISTVTGDLTLSIDWAFVDGSTNDPSVFTSNIEVVTGNVTINTTSEISLENLVKVGGNYSVTGHDIVDDNLLYAQSVSLDYPGDYIVEAIYTDEVKLNLDEPTTSKSASTSKLFLRNVSIHAYHTSLLIDTNFTAANPPSVRTTPPAMPATPIYPVFSQVNSAATGVLQSENISNVTFSGHIAVEKIVSNSVATLNVNNSNLPALEVVSTSLTVFTMPNVVELNSLNVNAPKLEAFVAISLTRVVTKITLSGIVSVEFTSLTVIGSLEVLSGSNIKLPKLAALPTETVLPSNVRVDSNLDEISQPGSGIASGGGGSSTTEGHQSGTTPHQSGNGGHQSGNGGHQSGTSGTGG
jgi:hypothetical protein